MISANFQFPQPWVTPMGPGSGGIGGIFGKVGSGIENAAKSVVDNNQVATGIRDVFSSFKGAGGTPAPGGAIGAPASDSFLQGGAPSAGAGSGIKQGLSEIGGGLLSGAENGALFGGIISAAVNGYEVVTGKEQLSQAAGGVTADTADGAVSGVAGAAMSGIALAAAGALGLTAGLPLTLLGLAAGFGGAFLGNTLFKGSGIYDDIKNAVTQFFGGTSAPGSANPIGGPFPRPTPMPMPVPVTLSQGRTLPTSRSN